jgi:hypothetical protein
MLWSFKRHNHETCMVVIWIFLCYLNLYELYSNIVICINISLLGGPGNSCCTIELLTEWYIIKQNILTQFYVFYHQSGWSGQLIKQLFIEVDNSNNCNREVSYIYLISFVSIKNHNPWCIQLLVIQN